MYYMLNLSVWMDLSTVIYLQHATVQVKLSAWSNCPWLNPSALVTGTNKRFLIITERWNIYQW